MRFAQFNLYREHFGHKDERVQDFLPDAWQIRLMDSVDERKSVIVSAPTSSGKTFASFYAMQRVLLDKQHPTGVVVYVAPTLSLINQMLASCYARFKHHEAGRDRKLFGVFTRDRVQNVGVCRILL